MFGYIKGYKLRDQFKLPLLLSPKFSIHLLM